MPCFDHYLARHGEFGVQALIECMERLEGIRSAVTAPLEERWNQVMGKESPLARRAA